MLDSLAPLSRVASRVVLEITERASLERMAGVAERIRGLRELGFRIALDDLGAGYAGLTSFATLTPDVVKVDMSLVRDIDGDPLRQKLVGSIASLCKSLGILVVGEGIETEGERAAVVSAGCDLLQGYLFGKPAALAPESGRAWARDS
jgi:EAL domain-containing protein (putative c-di-GMP-specific phosphodiesterase class I)